MAKYSQELNSEKNSVTTSPFNTVVFTFKDNILWFQEIFSTKHYAVNMEEIEVLVLSFVIYCFVTVR